MRHTIPKGMRFIKESIYLEKEKTLIIADLHLGWEDSFAKRGAFLPRTQKKELKSALDNILSQVRPETIILNGDLKHEFGKISNQEWEDLLWLIDSLGKTAKIISIEGNHDPLLDRILARRGLSTKPYCRLGQYFICHGDEYFKESETDSIKTIIIGHIHPARILSDGVREEKYKCFLVGRWKKKKVIVLPAFNPLTIGIEPDAKMSPYLPVSCTAYLIGKDKVYPFPGGLS